MGCGPSGYQEDHQDNEREDIKGHTDRFNQSATYRRVRYIP